MKERIVNNFRELAAQKGFQSVTMDELAARAGMSKRTIYRHFRSKDEIVEAVLDQFMAQMAGVITGIVNEETDLVTVFTRLLQHIPRAAGAFLNNPLVLGDLKQYYPHLWVKIEEFRAAKIQSILQLVVEQKQAGQLREIDPRIITAAFIASVQAVVNPDFILEHDLTFSAAVEQLVDLFVYGFLK
jgi:AcrR family transcriptional regulator